MITPDDTNDDNGYARVKRWREKNRAYVNLKQKEYRRRKKSAASSKAVEPRSPGCGDSGSTPEPKTLFSTKKVGELRMIVLPEQHLEESTMPVVKPQIFKNDHGVVISESAWKRLQELKKEAKERGYELDDYSQGVK